MSETLATPNTAPATPESAPAFDWGGVLGDAAPTLLPIVEAKKWTSPRQALESYAQLETLVGRKGVIVPGEKDGPEVQAKFRAALGVPDTADGYTLKAPEGIPEAAWDEGGIKALASKAHDLGLTPAQTQGLAEFIAGAQAAEMQRLADGVEPDGRKMDDVLRQEWGGQYDAKVEMAKRAAREFGGKPEVLQALEAKVGGAALVQMFARIGEALAEDVPVGMGKGRATPPDPKAELKTIMAPGSPYWQPMHPEYRATVERAKALFAADAAG